MEQSVEFDFCEKFKAIASHHSQYFAHIFQKIQLNLDMEI